MKIKVETRIDWGAILLGVTADDLAKLEEILATRVFDTPNVKMSIYKNRRGRWKGIYLWSKADLGTCRIDPMFATDYSYHLIPIEDLKITVEPESAF